MKIWISLPLAVLLAGCGGLTRQSSEPVVYRLSVPELAAGDALPADLLVALPTAAPGLEGERIAAAYPDRRLDYYAGARWGDELPIVVQSLLTGALRDSGRLHAVQGGASPFRVSHVLQVEIVRFEAAYAGEGPPTVHVTLAATLGRRQGAAAIGSWSASASAPAAADRMGAIAAAFDAAFASAATEISTRTLDAVAADLAAQQAPKK